jgi:hypothetical protein
VRFGILGLLATLVLVGCQERLTSPADCPALCPGGSPKVVDEILYPISGADSSFRGYVQPFSSAALLVSNGLQGFEERALIRFPRRTETVLVRDTARAYAIDSVTFFFNLVARDTNAAGLKLALYRLPANIDTSTSYADVDPAFVTANLIRVIDVPDTLRSGSLSTVFSGSDLSRIEIPPADTGVLALGVRLDAPTPTGARLGSVSGGAGAVFVTHATLDVPDTGTAKIRAFSLSPSFNSSLRPPEAPPDSTLLSVGGEPSARALLRFELPSRLRDSALIVRATLELTPVEPISGLPTDPAVLQALGLATDLGGKSPLRGPRLGAIPTDTVEAGATAVSLEVVRLMELWLGSTTIPSALVVSLAIPTLEAASFSRPIFYSTRAADVNLRPRLRISYLRSFPFESP